MPKRTGNVYGRTREHYEHNGYTFDIVEKPRSPMRNGRERDAFGIFDGLAFNSFELVGVQICRNADAKKHREKIEASPHARRWLLNGARAIELVSWERLKRKSKRGGYTKARYWVATVHVATLAHDTGSLEWTAYR